MTKARSFLLISLPVLTALLLATAPAAGQVILALHQGVLSGRVLSLPDSQAVSDASVTIRPVGSPSDPTAAGGGDAVELRSDANGRFSYPLAVGFYDVQVEAFGYEEGRRSSVPIREGQATEITLYLETAPFRLEEIVVMPSTYGMLREHVVSGQLLTREELEVQPHFGNDIFRAVAQVPGVTTHDYTSMPFVRGSRPEAVLTVLDGLELYEPYHLKQWDGSLSIVDVENVSDVDLTTGGFTAEYGDATTGVFSMRTPAVRPERTRTTLGLDFMSSMLKSEGSFDDGKGAWLVSGRRGFLDIIFELTGRNDEEDLHPSYYDVLSKVEYQVRPGHLVSAHILHAGDDNYGVEGDSTVYQHGYGSSYAWVNWEADLTEDLSARTVFSGGRVSRNRDGADYWRPGDPPAVDVRDQATFDFLGLRQDWQLRRWDRMMLKWGFDAKVGRADYDYFRWRKYWVPNSTDPIAPEWTLHFDTLNLAVEESGTEIGAYLAGRAQPMDQLTVEAGLRLDHQSHTDERQLAPRLNAAFQLSPYTSLRGAWGHYYQSHGLHQLWVSDGDTRFFPAQRAEQRVLGLQHILRNGISLRVEAYQRILTDPMPEYRNLEDFVEGLREEGPEDRVFLEPERGHARGIEFFAKSRVGDWISWSASYALSKAEEKIQGDWVLVPFDQRHAVNLQIGIRPTPEWSISAAWIYHSPWPATEPTFRAAQTVMGNTYTYRAYGPLNQDQLIPYKRVDFRAARKFETARGDLLFYVDIFNLFNRENAQAASYGAWWYQGRLMTDRTIRAQLEIMPSVGLQWTF